MSYIRLCKTVDDKGQLISPDKLYDYVTDSERQAYFGIYQYNEEHYKKFKETGSVRGIKDVTGNRLFLDFDSKDPTLAQIDAKEASKRLTQYVNPSNIEIYFSGNKGFHVGVTLNKFLTTEQMYDLAVNKIGKDLKTLDSTMYDAPQLLRVPGTRHPVSGLYKVPLSYSQLQEESLDNIKKIASSLDNIGEFGWEVVSLPESLYSPAKKESKPLKLVEPTLVDYTNKSPGWRNCKWSLLNGNFKAGERHQALLVIAATCRGLKYDKETTYYMCKSALKKQASLTGQEEFPKEELYINIIEQSIFTDNWEGGQYTCQKAGWLQTYCKSLGEHSCKDEKEEPVIVQISDISSDFKDYADNFDKNIIKTGIKNLDDNVLLTTSTFNGLLGNPGAGKTSLALQFLEHTSAQGIQANFQSLDMGKQIVYAKTIQRETGLPFREAIDLYRSDIKQAREIDERIAEKYKNISFNFRSGVTVQDMRRGVEEQEQRTGQKVKLLIADYLERISGPYSDATANSGFIANQLTDLANDLKLCLVCLLQTQKHSVPDVSDPLLSLKGVKGSSIIEQGCSSILTLWRDGYNPKTVNDDKYISFALVKTRFGGLWSDDFSWHGVTGSIRELSEEERDQLADFRKRKIDAKMEASKDNKGWE